MSRLWPETINIGLFADRCWLRRNGAEAGNVETVGSDPVAWLHSLDDLLSRQEKPFGILSGLRVVVSDSACMLTHLPWQEDLRSSSELKAYAHACFARQGKEPDSAWVLQTGFRKFRADGLAYALRYEWLYALRELARRYKLRLDSVLPASAAAYWHSRAAAKTTSLVMLAEADRLTAQIYENGHLFGIDVQPITVDLNTGARRLLGRVVAIHPDIGQVQFWSAAPAVVAGDDKFILASLSQARVLRLNHAWRVQ